MRENDGHYKRGEHPSRNAPKIVSDEKPYVEPGYEWGRKVGENVGTEAAELVKKEEERLGRKLTPAERDKILTGEGTKILKRNLIKSIMDLFEKKPPEGE